MMTDLEKFIDTYKQFGVDVKTYENNDGNTEISLNCPYGYTSTESEKFGGYPSFYSTLEFTKEGKFIRQDFWE